MLEKTVLIVLVKWLLAWLWSEAGSRPLAPSLNKDAGSRAQTCWSNWGSSLQSAVHLVYLLEANSNQAAFCDFLMGFVNHILFIVLRWLFQPGSVRKSQDQMVKQRPIKIPIKQPRTVCVWVSLSVVSASLQPPWTVAHQAPLSIEFCRQEYWRGLPFPSPGDLPDPGIKSRSPALWADSLLPMPPGKP